MSVQKHFLVNKVSVNIPHLSPKYVCVLVPYKHIECIHSVLLSCLCWPIGAFLSICGSLRKHRTCIQHAHARGKGMGTHLFPSRLDGAVRQTSCYPWEHFFSDLSFLVKDVLSLLHQLMASSDGCWKTCYLLLCTGLTSRLAGITAGSRRLTGEQRINPKCRHLRQSRSGSKI